MKLISELLNKKYIKEYFNIPKEANKLTNTRFYIRNGLEIDDVTKYAAGGIGSILQRVSTGCVGISGPFDWAHLFRFFIVAGLIDFNNANILDVGCGEAVLKRILRRGSRIAKFNYVGMDVRKRMLLNAARDEGKHEAAFFVTDLRKNWNFIKNDSFDFVIAMEVIEHLEEDQGKQFIKRCRMKLKQNGVLVLTTPQFGCKKLSERARRRLKYNDDNDYWEHHLKEYTRKELEELFNRFNLTVEGCYGYGTQISIFEKNLNKIPKAHRKTYHDVIKLAHKDMIIPLLSIPNPEIATFLMYILRK